MQTECQIELFTALIPNKRYTRCMHVELKEMHKFRQYILLFSTKNRSLLHG